MPTASPATNRHATGRRAHRLLTESPHPPVDPAPETAVEAIHLSDPLQEWTARYAEVGHRDGYLWKWCRKGVELTTLSCVDETLRDELCDTKVLGVMLDVLLDDVADRGGDPSWLEHLLGIPVGMQVPQPVNLSGDQERYLKFTIDLWFEIRRRLRPLPLFARYEDLLRFDYFQLFNTMRYSHLINNDLALLNLAEHDAYLPHNMHMMISSTMDLMGSPGFEHNELGLLREAMSKVQYMGRVGNLVTTWERELDDADFTSGVFAHVISLGRLSVRELQAPNRARIAGAIREGHSEEFFLERWREYRVALLEMQPLLTTVDLCGLVNGLERLLALHLASRGKK